VTGIEPALSAWESTDFTRNMHRDQHFRGSASDREYPLFTALNGTLMARPEAGGKGFVTDVGRIVATAARAMLQGEGRCAAHCQERSCCNTCTFRDERSDDTCTCYSASPHPRATGPEKGTEGQRIRESGDTGDTRPRLLPPKITLVFAGQTLCGDTGDTGDTFERQDLDELRAVDGAGWRKPRGSLGMRSPRTEPPPA
jgi:hypothetical protein